MSCIQIMQRVEQFIAKKTVESSDAKNLKFYVAALLARELTGIPQPVYEKLPVVAKIDEAAIAIAFKRVNKIYTGLSKKTDKDAVARGTFLLKKITDQWKRRQGMAKIGVGNAKAKAAV